MSRSGLLLLGSTGLRYRRRLAVLGSNWKGHVKELFALKLAGLEALRHHLGIFAFKVGLVFRINLFFLSSDNNGLFVEATLTIGIVIHILVGRSQQCGTTLEPAYTYVGFFFVRCTVIIIFTVVVVVIR